MKHCSKCKTLLPEKNFYKDKDTGSGLYSCCKICHSKYCKKWRAKRKNKEYMKKYNIAWKKKNQKHHLYYIRNWYRKQRKENPKFRIDDSMASSIYLALKGKKAGRKWEDLVGYTLKELLQWLENQFDNKMNWYNYGNYWSIDHIKPRSLFKYENAEDPEFKKCWSLMPFKIL